MKKIINKIVSKIQKSVSAVQASVENKLGEGYVDTGVKIIIAVVIGSLILGGLYLLFAGDTGLIPDRGRPIPHTTEQLSPCTTAIEPVL